MKNERYDDKIHVPDMASNSTGRLAASQPGEPPQPRCPTCGSSKLSEARTSTSNFRTYIECKACHEMFWIDSASDFAQFFGPSAPSPLPTYEQAKPNIGWGWSGFRIEDENSLKFTFNRMRDAMQKCLGVVTSPQQRCEGCITHDLDVFEHDGCFVDKVVDLEQARWQKALYELSRKHAIAPNEIDGSGCDSGDPLDLTLAEVGQVICQLENPQDYRVAPSGSAGQEPLYSEQEMKELGLKASTINYGAEGSATMYSKAEPEGRAESVCETCGSSDPSPSPCSNPWHRNRRAESAAEPPSVLKNFSVEKVLADFPDEPPQPVVSASPDFPINAEELLAQYDEEHHDYLGGRPHQWQAWREKLLAKLAAAQPVADNRMRCTECKEPVCDHLAAKLIPWLESYVQPVAANPSKVEQAIADAVQEIVERLMAYGCHSTISDTITKHLGPFFTQVSQPPTLDKATLEAVAEDGLLVTWDKDYKFNFSQVVRLMAEFAIEFAAPVTPVSGPDIKCEIGTGEPKSFLEIVKAYRLNRGWQEGADLDAAIAFIERTPVSGNGTEPRDPEALIVIFAARITNAAIGNHGKTPPENDAVNRRILRDLLAEYAQWLTGAASHNGQGWAALKEADLEYVRQALIGATDAMPCACKAGSEDGPCVSCAANHSAAIIETLQKKLAALPAPPSEADGPRRRNEPN